MSLRSEVLQALNAICEGAGVTAREMHWVQ